MVVRLLAGSLQSRRGESAEGGGARWGRLSPMEAWVSHGEQALGAPGTSLERHVWAGPGWDRG